MNQTIETLLSHRSIRHFEEKPLSKEQIETIVSSAQAASTSSNIQAYSIIGITDPDKKRKLAELQGIKVMLREMVISLFFVQIYIVMKLSVNWRMRRLRLLLKVRRSLWCAL